MFSNKIKRQFLHRMISSQKINQLKNGFENMKQNRLIFKAKCFWLKKYFNAFKIEEKEVKSFLKGFLA